MKSLRKLEINETLLAAIVCFFVLLVVLVIFNNQLELRKADIDKGFICQEKYLNDEQKIAALGKFINQYIGIYPNATLEDLLEYRLYLLNKHRCEKTLNIIRENDRKTGFEDVQ